MSVADRLTKLTTDITSAYTSIDNKGGTIPANKNTDNLHTAIDSIEVIEQATAEGENLSLVNTKAMPYKDYKVKGKSEQATRSGKNLIGVINGNGTQAQVNYSIEDGEVTLNGTSNAYGYINVLSSIKTDGNYTLSIISISGTGSTIGFRGNSGTTQKFFILSTTTATKSLTDVATCDSFDIFVIPNTTYTNFKFKIQLEQGSTATSYEPYGASPSPDYPSEIHSVADDVNLFDKDTNITLNKSFSSAGDIIDLPYICLQNEYIKVNQNTNYTLSTTTDVSGVPDTRLVICEYDNNKNFIQRNLGVSVQSYSVKTTATTKYIRISAPNISLNTLSLKKGSTLLPYSPYNQGTVTIKQEKIKNYLNWDKFIDYSNWTNSNSPGYKSFEITGLNINKTYTLCRTDTAGYGETSKYAGFNKGNNNGNMFLHSTDSSRNLQSVSDTPSEDGKIYITMYMSSQSDLNDYINIIKKCWVIEGTEYQEYVNNNYTIQTEPLRSLPNGVKDTIEEDGIHRRVGRVVLNGSEDWSTTGTFTSGIYRLECSALNGIIKAPSSPNISPAILCDYYNAITNNQSYTETEGISISASGSIRIYDSNYNTDDISLYKTWLSTHNTEVLYELAEEVIEPLTQNQATTMLDIIKTGSYEGTTNIYTDEDVKPTIGVDYYKKV